MITTKSISAILSGFILLLAPTLFGQWTELELSGGWITCLKSLPQNQGKLFCGVLQGGAYVSTDRGEHWESLPALGSAPVYDLSLQPDGSIYFATGGGLFRSRNSGETWEKMWSAPTWQVVGLNDRVVFADTSQLTESLFRERHPTNRPWLISQDGGNHWDVATGTVDPGKAFELLDPVEKRGSILALGDSLVFRSNGLRIYKSTLDQPTTWEYLNVFHAAFSVYCQSFLFLPDTGTNLYAFAEYYDFHPGGEFTGGVFKSEDFGQSWERLKFANSVTAAVVQDNQMFVGTTLGEACNTSSELLRYFPETGVSEKLGTFGGDIVAILADFWNEGELIIATEGGIFKTKDFGAHWFPANAGIYQSQVVAVQAFPWGESERIVAAVFKGGIWSSDDFGSSWQIQNSLAYVLPGLLEQAPNQSGHLIAGGALIFTSDEGGNRWQPFLNYEFPAAYYGWYGRALDLAIDPTNSAHALVHYSDHSLDHYAGIVCAETFDFGQSWVAHKFWSDEFDFSWKAEFDSQKNRLWVSHYPMHYLQRPTVPTFRVFDAAGENLLLSVTLPDSAAATFWCVAGDSCFVISSTTGKFYHSPDLGTTWKVVPLPELTSSQFWQDWAVLEEFGELKLAPDGATLFFVYPGTGILMSRDWETWHDLNAGLPTKNIYQIEFSPADPEIIYLATNAGIFQGDYTLALENRPVKSETNLPPERFRLYPNFPNPFNATTTIQYQTGKPGKVTLTIFNARGAELERLVDDQFISAGKYSLTWDAVRYASGVYFIQLKMAGEKQVHKVLLLK